MVLDFVTFIITFRAFEYVGKVMGNHMQGV